MSRLPMPPMFPREGIWGICMPPPSIDDPICVDDEEDDDELLIIDEEELIIFEEEPIIFDMSADMRDPEYIRRQ